MTGFKKQVEAFKLYQTQLAVILACTVESLKLQSETGVLFAPIQGVPRPKQEHGFAKAGEGIIPGIDPLEVPFNIEISKEA